MNRTPVPELSIVIPAYNEENRIGSTLDTFSAYFKKSGKKYEIVVIMDGCTDGTGRVVREKARNHGNIRFREFEVNAGKGGGLLKGFLEARGRYIAYTDADGATPPGEMMRLLKEIGDYDGIIGSRWMKGSVILEKQPLARRVASRGFNLLTRMVLGLPYKDTQCPAKIFRGDTLRKIASELKVTNFAFDALLLFTAKKQGYRIKEVPIEWKDKDLSSLKMSRAIPRMLFSVVKFRLFSQIK